MEIKQIGIIELDRLANYFFDNRSNLEKVISDFGEVESTNGHGTLFLKPRDPVFKVFWIHCKDDQIQTVGFGSPEINIPLKTLYTAYRKYREGFVPYDDEYNYLFYSSDDYKYAIHISSKKKLLIGEEIIEDIPINGLVIKLKE